MNKLEQLQQFKKLGIPVPLFREVQWAEDLKTTDISWELQFEFPVAVLSSFSTRDLKEKQALQNYFNVEQKKLTESVGKVFDSYPVTKGERVVVMEMVHPEIAGTVQTRPGGASILEYLGTNETEKNYLLLPAFSKGDATISRFRKFWKPFSKSHPHYAYVRDFIQLSIYIHQFLKAHPEFAKVPCHFSFSMERGKMYLLQVEKMWNETATVREPIGRIPISLLNEGSLDKSKWLDSWEQDLVDGVNKELLKWTKTPLMVYEKGQTYLPLEQLQLLMQEWGLSSSLKDIYAPTKDQLHLRTRPLKLLANFRKWGGLFWQLGRLKRRLKRWLYVVSRQSEYKYQQRKAWWVNKPGVAWEDYKSDLLESNIQYVVLKVMLVVKYYLWTLWGQKMGTWQSANPLPTSPYNDLATYFSLWQGKQEKEAFLDRWGHRGMREEDIAFTRYEEYSAEKWMELLFQKVPQASMRFDNKLHSRFSLKKVLLNPIYKQARLIEWFRDKAIWQLWRYRYELKEIEEKWAFPGMPYHPLLPFQSKKVPLMEKTSIKTPVIRKLSKGDGMFKGTGIRSGRIKGRIWRLDELPKKPMPRPDFERIILFLPSLDRVFLPYWVQVDGILVAAANAWQVEAIQLKQATLPVVIQLGALDLKTGDWVEVDGEKGQVRVLNSDKL